MIGKNTRYYKPIITITKAIIDFLDRLLIHLEEEPKKVLRDSGDPFFKLRYYAPEKFLYRSACIKNRKYAQR